MLSFSCVDMTGLNVTDTHGGDDIEELCGRCVHHKLCQFRIHPDCEKCSGTKVQFITSLVYITARN